MNNILTANGDSDKLIKISTSKMAFKQMEMIGQFLDRLKLLGVKSQETFQTVDLYENKNIIQVIDSIFALSRTVHHLGFPLLGPKLAEKNTRVFTKEQLDASKAAVPLLAKFTSKSGNNSGMGSVRQVYNPDLGVGDTTAVTKLMGGLQIEAKKEPLGVSFGATRQIGGVYEDKDNAKSEADCEVPEQDESKVEASPLNVASNLFESYHEEEDDEVEVCVIDDDFIDGYYDEVSPTIESKGVVKEM